MIYSSCDMYIYYFLVTFSYHIVLVDGINLTDDVQTDSTDLHDGLITNLVLSSTSVWTNAFGMLHAAMSQPSYALTTAVKSVPSMLTVGLITSLHSIYAYCVLPFTQCWDFIVLSLFSVRNRSDSIALCLSDFLSERLSTGLKQDLSCTCFISL